MEIAVRINGEAATVEATTVAGLLAARGIDRNGRGTAVALNGAVVPRRDWDSTQITADDDVEIVRPFSGG
ncbi:MAG: sulfur carrier protein ThiS [Alphaproteobacteria bacterium]